MVFTKRKTPKFELKLQIDGEDINEVHKTKFLGVIIDNKLTWKEHMRLNIKRNWYDYQGQTLS